MKKTVQVKLNEADIEELKNVATRKGHNLSSMIRLLVKEFLKTIKGES